jgi:hypothetical protein
MTTTTKLSLCALLATAMSFGTARADDKGTSSSGPGIEVYYDIKAPDAKDPKQEGKAPTIEATVIGGPMIPFEKFTLRDANAKVPVELHVASHRDFSQGTETVAVAIVMNTWEIWVGNDKVLDESDPSRYPGVLESLEAALDGVHFTEAGPPGSKGMVVTYADKASIKIPMGPLSNITGSALGSQKDYMGTKGVEMVKGIELALGELHTVTASRKVLIVVCDGNDTNNEVAKLALANDKKLAANDHIQTFAIIYKGALSDPGNVIAAMVPNATTVTSAELIAGTISTILKRMNDRYYLTFNGFDEKTEQGLIWDGKPHDLALKIEKDDVDTQSVTLAPIWSQPHHNGFPWLLILIIGGSILLLLIIILIATRKKPEPVAVVAPVMAVAEAPKPAGPMKTVMIGIGGDQDGFPVVGWLVPLNGQNAYQTFRLKPGLTKIGTQYPADIVVNDGFMSTEHCQITSSPTGFTMLDPGSTNGCYVNDRKTQKHDLVDNDVITLGKTNFKFKSIN